MELYKESLLNKIEDDLTGRNQNWDAVDAHLADYDAHKAEDAQKHITESGENTNGRYVKFDDGTQIVFGLNSVNVDVTNTYFAKTVTFPKSFANLNMSIFLTKKGAFDGAFATTMGYRVESSNIFTVYALSPTNAKYTLTGTVNFSYAAIGRWK